MTDYAQSVAQALLHVGAVKLRPEQPFKWSSGWLSPIYCDNRLTLSFPETRGLIKAGLTELVSQHFPNAGSIAGVATAGVPQGALVADMLELPYLYVRPKPKDHGMENLIEGRIVTGQKVVLVEDLISTGGSSLKAAEALRDAGFEVLGMVAIFTYGFDVAEENFRKAGITLKVLSDYDALLKEALRSGYIHNDALSSLKEWKKDPSVWGISK